MEALSVKLAAVLLLISPCILALPQYNYPQPTGGGYTAYGPAPSSSGCSTCSSSSSFAGSGSQQLDSAGASFGEGQFSRPPGGGGSNLNTECRRVETAPGQFKFTCDGVSSDLITLRSEHILWLTSDGSGPQVVDIEVPNYKIEELIKAGYKTSPGGATKINVLLKRPEQSADAEVDVPKGVAGSTSVNLQYEAAAGEKIHFPNDRGYRPLSGPILPPLQDGRGRRQVQGKN